MPKDLDQSDVDRDGERMRDEQWVPEYDAEDDPAYQAYLEREYARGPLAFQPEMMPCYGCGKPDAPIERKVVRVIEPREGAFDPTVAYELDCGHVAIDV